MPVRPRSPLNRGENHNGNPAGIGFLALAPRGSRDQRRDDLRTGVLGGRRPPVRQLADGRPVQAVPGLPTVAPLSADVPLRRVSPAGISSAVHGPARATGADLAPRRDGPARPVDRRRRPQQSVREHDDGDRPGRHEATLEDLDDRQPCQISASAVVLGRDHTHHGERSRRSGGGQRWSSIEHHPPGSDRRGDAGPGRAGPESPRSGMSDLGVVAIGRNEGNGSDAAWVALAKAGQGPRRPHVDSGSTDGAPKLARGSMVGRGRRARHVAPGLARPGAR